MYFVSTDRGCCQLYFFHEVLDETGGVLWQVIKSWAKMYPYSTEVENEAGSVIGY